MKNAQEYKLLLIKAIYNSFTMLVFMYLYKYLMQKLSLSSEKQTNAFNRAAEFGADGAVIYSMIKGIKGIAQIEHEIMNLTAAFPDLQIDIADIFAVADGEGKYKVWMRYYFAGTNSAYSLYGAPTGLSLDIKKSLSMSVFHMEDIEGEWLITAEETMHPCDYIRAICTGDSTFTNLQL